MKIKILIIVSSFVISTAMAKQAAIVTKTSELLYQTNIGYKNRVIVKMDSSGFFIDGFPVSTLGVIRNTKNFKEIFSTIAPSTPIRCEQGHYSLMIHISKNKKIESGCIDSKRFQSLFEIFESISLYGSNKNPDVTLKK